MWGYLLQLVFALIVLQTSWGYDLFDWLGKRVTEFLDHTDVGAIFVFGEKYTDHFFAFKVNKNKVSYNLYTALTIIWKIYVHVYYFC